MSYDKIKKNMCPILFEYWTQCIDVSILQKSYNNLKIELDSNILPNEYKYYCELNLLKLKLGLNI